MKRMNSLLHKGFQASKCKVHLRMGIARLIILSNTMRIKIPSYRKSVAVSLRSKKTESLARLQVVQVIREQNLLEAYELISLYAQQIFDDMTRIDSQKTCPPDVKEGISTLLFAISRCSELVELAEMRPMFLSKYGKEFVSAAEELRHECGVNGRVIEKLSTSPPTGELKLEVMKAIAAEHNVEWDPAPFEREITVVPDDLLDGPTVFTSADTFRTVIDDFPSVPNHDPTLGFHASSSSPTSQPDIFTSSESGGFAEDKHMNKVKHKNKPGSVGKSESTVRSSGPPVRKPPPRSSPKEDDSTFEGGRLDLDSDSMEAYPRRNLRRETNIFPALSSLERFKGDESRRNSIGVPREKSGRSHVKTAPRDIDKHGLHEQRKHNRRMSQGAHVDDNEDPKCRNGDCGGDNGPESDDSSFPRSTTNGGVSWNKRFIRGTCNEEDSDEIIGSSRDTSEHTPNYQWWEAAGQVSPRLQGSRRRDSINNTRIVECLDKDIFNPSPNFSVKEQRRKTPSFKTSEDISAPQQKFGIVKSGPEFDVPPRSKRTPGHSGYEDEPTDDNDDDDDYHQTIHLETVDEPSHRGRRMSMPGYVCEKSKYLAGESDDFSGKTGGSSERRATIGPEDFRGSMTKDSKEPTRRKDGDPGIGRQTTRFNNSNNHTERHTDRPSLRVSKQPIFDDEDSPRLLSSPREKPPRFVSDSSPYDDELAQSTPRTVSKLLSVKTDLSPSVSPRETTMDHRRVQLYNVERSSRTPRSHLRQQPSEDRMSPNQDDQPQSRPSYFKAPDLEVLIQMFGKKK